MDNLNITDCQKLIVAKLLGKGIWLDPWLYRRCVYLSLPLPAHERRAKNLGHYKVYNRPGIRITPTGRIIAQASGKG